MNFGLASSGRAFGWLRKTFDFQSTAQPAVDVFGIVQPHVDILGTDNYRFVESIGFGGNLGTVFQPGGIVPSNEVWAILVFSATHNDPVARELAIGVRLPDPTATVDHWFASGLRNILVPIGKETPFYLGPGCALVIAAFNIAGVNSATGRYIRVRLPLGEYMAGI